MGNTGETTIPIHKPSRHKLSSRNRSTIEIDNDVREALRAEGSKGESFSDIIRRLLTCR